MIPNLTNTAFWDIDFDKLDPDRNSVFIMEKVFNYGLWEDYLAIIKYYGIEKIKDDIVKGAYYKKKVFNFLCVIFELQPEQFTCYMRRQSQPQHWNY